MQARVLGEFWMKGHPQKVALLDPYDSVIEPSDHPHPQTDLFHPRRPDKDARIRVFWPLVRQVKCNLRLEAVDLPPKCVATHGHVHDAEKGLPRARGAPGQHDEAGAGTEDGPFGHELSQRTGEAVLLYELTHGGAFAAGDDETIELLELRRQAHLPHPGPQAPEHAGVLAEGALEGEDADG